MGRKQHLIELVFTHIPEITSGLQGLCLCKKPERKLLSFLRDEGIWEGGPKEGSQVSMANCSLSVLSEHTPAQG